MICLSLSILLVSTGLIPKDWALLLLGIAVGFVVAAGWYRR